MLDRAKPFANHALNALRHVRRELTGMNIDIVITAWGDWHIGTLRMCALPSALSPRNLPALAARHRCRLRLLTREADIDKIAGLEGLAAVRALMPVEVRAMTAESVVAAPSHLAWWHAAGQEAAQAGAMVLNLPPDVIFPDGCLIRMVQPLAAGKMAVLAPPQLRVVEETIRPELNARRANPNDALTLSASETVALGLRHLHPLFAEVIDGNPFGRPGIEYLWPVGNEGLILCQTTREIIAYDPAACDISDRFLVRNASDMSSVHTSTDAADLFFLSLAPLMKDFGLALQGHPVTARFLARWSTHPDNDVPLADFLPDKLVRLAAKEPTPELWRAAEARARAWVRDYKRWRDLFKVWRKAREIDCIAAGRLIGLAAHVLDVPRLFATDAPIVALLPTNSTLRSAELRRVIGTWNDDALTQYMRAHFAEGEFQLPLAGRSAALRTLDNREHVLTRDGAGVLHLDGRPVPEPDSVGRCTVVAIEGFLGPAAPEKHRPASGRGAIEEMRT